MLDTDKKVKKYKITVGNISVVIFLIFVIYFFIPFLFDFFLPLEGLELQVSHCHPIIDQLLQ